MEPIEKPSYLPFSIQTGAILAVLGTAITYVSMYRFISLPPAGTMFSIWMLVPLLTFLLTCFGGLLVVRAYAKATDLPMKAGQGAVIGLVTGLVITLFMTLIGQVWILLIDPSLMDRYMEAMIANFEAVPNLPRETLDGMIDNLHAQTQAQKSLSGILLGALGTAAFIGILNLVTGIIGVSIFAKKEEIL